MNKRSCYFKGNLATREEQNGDKYIEGYFVVFNQETELWDGVFEKIHPNALDESLANNDIRCLFNHQSGAVLGRVSADTLKCTVDEHGLYAKVKINANDSMAMDVYARVQRKDISGCSFGFTPISEDYTIDDDNNIHWTVQKADVIEISVCTFPAYPQTEISARKADFREIMRATETNISRRKSVLKERIEKLC